MEAHGTTTFCPRCSTPLPGEGQFCPVCGGRVTTPPPEPPQNPFQELQERLQTATKGRFQVVRVLGRGAMGVVFLAQQTSFNRPVAIKVLQPYLQKNPEVIQRFEREVRAQARLNHPNILSVLHADREEDLSYFLTPFIDGPSLRAYLRNEPRPPLPVVLRAMHELGDALHYAHTCRVIHRDVKPENIIVDSSSGRMILTDFGIAKALSETDTALTQTFGSIGTPLYMAPEQAERPSQVDGRSDQYALGLIGYEMLAGRPVMEGASHADIVHKQKYEMPPDLSKVRPDVPGALSAAIMRAIQKSPDDRFPTIEAFLAALPTVKTQEQPQPGPSFSEALKQFGSTRFGQVALFLAGTVGVAALTLLVYFLLTGSVGR